MKIDRFKSLKGLIMFLQTDVQVLYLFGNVRKGVK